MGIVHRTTGIVMSIAVCILMAPTIIISAGLLNWAQILSSPKI